MEMPGLESHLTRWHGGDPLRAHVAEVVLGVARAAAEIAVRVRLGYLAASRGEETPAALRQWAADRLLASLEGASVAFIASRGLEAPVAVQRGAPLAVTVHPLDGATNLDANVSVGTIFSVLPSEESRGADAVLLQPGNRLLASGYVIYGPHCALALSLGSGTQIFTLGDDGFQLTHADVMTARTSNEYAINASNYRFWSESIRAYIDDCIAGTEGARSADVSMRWVGSLVGECHRILVRGGVFLSPRDTRRGNEHGRLRLVFEANPIAFLVENAGGKAIDGFTRILDLQPTDLHQRTPLMFGSASEIDRIARYKANPSDIFERSPLFGQRGLLKV